MKKILFSLMIVAICIFAFAVSVSAKTVISESNLDANGDIVGDLLVDLGDDYHIVSVDISYLDKNGQEKNGKFYYETSYWSQRNQRQVKYVYVPNDFDMSQIIYILDKFDKDGNGEYAGTELIKLYQGGGAFKIYTYATYENATFTETANAINDIEIISYSKYFEKFADNGFGSKAPKLTTITYNGREPIADTLIISPLINEIFNGAFGGDGRSLTSNTIYTPFKKVIFEDRTISVSFGQYCFTRCIIEEIYFGSGTYYLNGSDRIALLFGADYSNGDGATLKNVIVHSEANIATGSISWNVGSYDVIVLGKESDAKSYYESTNQQRFPNASSVTYNPCYYGHTLNDDYNCETSLVCSACDEILAQAITHKGQIAIKYENGFGQKGEKHIICQNEGCNYNDKVSVEPLFVTDGYSIPEDGRGEMAICFTVNKNALNEYEAINGDAITYGVFAIAYKNIGDKEIIDTESAVTAEVGREYVSFEFKLVNIETEAHKNAQISFGAYVIDKNGSVSYIQPGTPNEGDKFAYITYNTIANAN